MSNWQWWLRSQMRRLRESDATQRLRFILRRHLQAPKRLALVICGLLFLFYCFFSSRSSITHTVSQSCLEEKILAFDGELKNYSMARDGDGIFFVGNGYVGVGEDGELRAASGKSLSILTGFFPLVSLNFDEATDLKQAILTDFLRGKVIKLQCFSVQDKECVCATTTTFVHRTKKNVLMEEVRITNPTKLSVKVRTSRGAAPAWKSIMEKKTDGSLLMRDDLGVGGGVGGSIICSSTIAESLIQPRREESFRFVCTVDIREKDGNGKWRNLSREEAMAAFSHLKEDLTVEEQHEKAWRKLNDVTFHLSHSLASNVLNGLLINSTRYVIMSSVREFLLEDGITQQEKMIIELKASRRDLCYTGHSTMLFPSRLWAKTKNSEEVVSLVDTWLLTLEKRGCANLVSMGASGVAQAFVLSLSAATFHDGHLELGMDPADMHREVRVSGLELNDAAKAKLSFEVGISDNRPFLMVSSSSEVYACDGGCRSDPVRVSPMGTKITVMLTKPLTSILYVAPNRRHLTQLRSAIHVSEIDVAPPHEEDIISAHKGEGGGLPTSVWVLLVIVLVAFHVFLVLILCSEWKKSDSAPFNPYLRQRYLREH